jgi:arylformamidase
LNRQIDWDNCYANAPNIPGGDRWPGLWVQPAECFRRELVADGRASLNLAYGDGERNVFDLFLPDREPKGLVFFIHGGFWMKLDKSYWSHLAAGPLAHEHAVAIPSYTLCPDIRIGGIVREVARAIENAASQVAGPIRLVGHSAGGHLATRMITVCTPLDRQVQARIASTLSISGLHDLRPLMRTKMNGTLLIDEAEATSESPVLARPLEDVSLTCWVGGAERAEFRRQNSLLVNIWRGLGANTVGFEEDDKHHFDVIEGLIDPNHPMVKGLMAPIF